MGLSGSPGGVLLREWVEGRGEQGEEVGREVREQRRGREGSRKQSMPSQSSVVAAARALRR